VATIITESKGAVGVRLKSGEELFAPLIISAVGAQNTYTGLLSDEVLAQYKITVPKMEPSHGHMTAFVSLDGPYEDFDLKPWNIHSFPDLPKYDYDISQLQRAFYDKPFEQPGCLVTLTCPSAKDPLYSRDYPNTSNVLLLTEAKIEWFDDMRTGNHGNRAEEYTEFKARFEKLFLDRLYLYYPKCKGHVTRVDVGSPLTTNHYLNTQRGESYGLAWGPDRFKPEVLEVLHPVTPIPGLLLTGEATLFGGFVGAMMSGFVSSLKVLGWLSLMKIFLTTPMPVDTSPRPEHPSQGLKVACYLCIGAVCYSFGCNAWSVFNAVFSP
jgi:all-trans-retinol 13,14-reductase